MATGVSLLSTASWSYRNWSIQVAAIRPIAATWVDTAAATGPVGWPGRHGNSRPKAYQN